MRPEAKFGRKPETADRSWRMPRFENFKPHHMSNGTIVDGSSRVGNSNLSGRGLLSRRPYYWNTSG